VVLEVMANNLRQRRAELDEVEYLDDNEQKELITQLQSSNDRWNYIFQNTLTIISFLLGMVKLYSAFSHFRTPFGVSHLAPYSQSFGYLIVSFIEYLSASGYAMLALSVNPYIIRGYTKQWLQIFVFFSFLFIFVSLCIYEPSLWWNHILVCGGNVAIAAVCFYLHHSISNSGKELNKLKKVMYSYKKA